MEKRPVGEPHAASGAYMKCRRNVDSRAIPEGDASGVDKEKIRFVSAFGLEREQPIDARERPAAYSRHDVVERRVSGEHRRISGSQDETVEAVKEILAR